MAHNTQKKSVENSQDSSRKKAKWNSNTTHIFCDVCVTAINKGLRPSTHFNTKGWEFVVSNFQKLSGLVYWKPQLKNKWDSLRTEWKLWKELIGKETGLGWDPRLETVDATPEWWNGKLQMNKDYAKFQKKGLDPELVLKNDLMFGTTVATGEFAWTPSSNADVPTYSGPNEDDIISLNESEDDPLQKSMDRFIQEEDDTISDDNSNICKRRKTGKEKDESAQKIAPRSDVKSHRLASRTLWFVLIYVDKSVKIADFGVARNVE
ncbi:L10-interacting MYB domain-containing protein-like [Heracleum sosnowskyi]|uniref:L10-interacting MYB domain-containing protein-like n=1 Tax=Heracleum sosnowskyi TaxID=360622 RepID=A0AAD8MZ99_9APIA|nr:L10-interacting MYB domain-containing protein-like [Heracleum sosnowskyi]